MKLGLLNRIGLESGPAEWASQLWQRVFSNNTLRDYSYGMYGGGECIALSKFVRMAMEYRKVQKYWNHFTLNIA